MSYPKPSLLERFLLPFKMIYWRWFWHCPDYDGESVVPEDKPPRSKHHVSRGQVLRP